MQEVAVTAMNFGDEYYAELQNHYTHMKQLFTDGLRNLGFKFTEPQGTYFVMMDISEFGYDRRMAAGEFGAVSGIGMTGSGAVRPDELFCMDLAKKVGVAAVPGSSFFREPVNHLVRFHFAKKDETLIEALNRLESVRKLLK